MKKISFLLFVIASMAGVSCTTDEPEIFTTLHGVVTEAETAECIGGVTITLSPGGNTQVTGSDGRYEFPDLDARQYTVTAQKTGYSTNRKIIETVSGEATEANISMRKLAE